jgi:hypothetical protein
VKTHRVLVIEVRVFEQLQTGDEYGEQLLKEPLNVFIHGSAVDVQVAAAELSSLRDRKDVIAHRTYETIKFAANKIAHTIADRIGDWLIYTGR